MSKISFFVIAVVIAGLLALVCVFAYGAMFQHDRYWHGTIARVQKTEAAIIRSIFDVPELARKLPRNPDVLERMFAPVEGKLAVIIRQGESAMFSNVKEQWTLGSAVEDFEVGSLKVTIYSYAPPTWGSRYARWIKQPNRWLEPSFDFITYPFIFFFLIFLTFLYALGWRIRAQYLSKDVLSKLNGESGN